MADSAVENFARRWFSE